MMDRAEHNAPPFVPAGRRRRCADNGTGRKYAILRIPQGMAFAMMEASDDLAIASGGYWSYGSPGMTLRGALPVCTRITLR